MQPNDDGQALLKPRRAIKSGGTMGSMANADLHSEASWRRPAQLIVTAHRQDLRQLPRGETIQVNFARGASERRTRSWRSFRG